MTIDEIRIRLTTLKLEFMHSRKIVKQLDKDIAGLDEIMERNFSAYWNYDEQCYEQ